MKTRNLFSTVCLLAMTLTAISQTPASVTFSLAGNNETVKSDIVQPEFTGLEECEDLKEFLDKHLRIPKHVQNWEILAPLVIRFKVLPNRDISDFQVVQGIVPDFDEAVLELMKSTNGMWNPGMINDHPVPMEKEVTFILNTSNKDVIELYKSAQWDKNRADKLLKEGKYHRAIKFYSRSIESVPSCDQSIFRRGLAKYYTGDVEGALNDFERVSDLGSHLADQMLPKLNEVADYINNELLANSINFK
ncbi:MAG: hypothetical protein ABFS32_19430 [Bacteroidota bacterium]